MSPKQAREMGNRATYYAQAHLDSAVAAEVSISLVGFEWASSRRSVFDYSRQANGWG